VLRDGKELVLKTKVESLRAATALGSQIVAELQGATVGTIESGGKPNAVMVVEVEPDSPAWSHGLRPGDVIVAVNRRKVGSTREPIAALKAPGRAVLSVVRGIRIRDCSTAMRTRKRKRSQRILVDTFPSVPPWRK
jgi:serine protease Do/serine protease DegQ